MSRNTPPPDPLNLDAFWMPFTANRQFKAAPRIVHRAQGAYFYDRDDRPLFDSLSGLWCTPLGHGRPEIAEAVSRQMTELDFAPTFQMGHPLAFELATRLADALPASLDRVFFVNSGSDAADTSMKMARAYWRLRGKPGKTKLVGRARGYHGVNFAGTSLGGIGNNRKLFGQLVDADHLPHTLLPENRFSKGLPQFGGPELADTLLDIIALHDASNIAAVIVEPVAGSGGVLPPPAGYLERLRQICDEHEILLVFDEVITGFGRTGAPFAADTFGVVPDIMNLAKALTNGTIPMGAVAARREIYDTFMAAGGADHAIEFPHGYTYSAHPVACAAALACLDVYQADHGAVYRQSAALGLSLEKAVHGLRDAPHVQDIRNFGLAAAVELVARDGDPAIRPLEAAQMCWQEGLYVRFGGDTLQLAPPFVSTHEEVTSMCATIGRVLNSLA